MKIKGLLILAIISISYIAQANVNDCDWKTRKVRFNIETVTNLDGVDRDSRKVVAEHPMTERVLNGSITVYKMCETANGLHLKEVSVPATARMSLYGLNLRGALMDYINTGFYIRNFEGKQLQSVIDNPFYGVKLAASAALGVGVNPNTSVLISSSGMFITDMESIVAIPGIALGVTISTARIKIYADFSSISEADAQLLGKTL